MNSRERFLAACYGKEVDRPPVWLMRQAGRYLPEYRNLRSKYSFWEMVKSPERAAKVSLQPIERYGMDAIIMFCDILVIQDAMGLTVTYEKGGPQIRPLITTEADLEHLKPVRPEHAFSYIGETLERLCEKAHPDIAVLGFAGAPFTLASYMVTGGPSKNVNDLKTLAYQKPVLYDHIMSRITHVVTGLLRLQVSAGADMVQLFDTWAWHLSPEDYENLALPYTKRIIEGLADLKVPVSSYLRNVAGHLESAASSGCQVLSTDCSIRLEDAKNRLDPSIALQGNFDPIILKDKPENIRTKVHKAIETMKGRGYIVNLGQGLTPDTPLEGVEAFVNAVKEWKY